jgi:hypothetical protein
VRADCEDDAISVTTEALGDVGIGFEEEYGEARNANAGDYCIAFEAQLMK